MARSVNLAEIRFAAHALGWFDAVREPDEALFVLAEENRTSILHVVDSPTFWARAVTRERLDMRARRADAERISQPAALRGILDAERALAFIAERTP